MDEVVLFGDFFDMNEHGSQHRIYRPLSDQSKLVRVLEEYNMRLNMGEQVSDLVDGADYMSVYQWMDVFDS